MAAVSCFARADAAFPQERIVFNAQTPFFNVDQDREMSLLGLLDLVDECRQTPKPPRGEYETREEYENRLGQENVNCESLLSFSGFLDAPVLLVYKVDAELFQFSLRLDADWFPNTESELFLRPVNHMVYVYPEEERVKKGEPQLYYRSRVEEMRKRNVHPIYYEKAVVSDEYFYKGFVDSFTHEFFIDEYASSRWRVLRPMWDLIKLDLRLYSVVDRARALKARESGLVWRVHFDYKHAGVRNRATMLITAIEIFDTLNNKSLVKIEI